MEHIEDLTLYTYSGFRDNHAKDSQVLRTKALRACGYLNLVEIF
jgi:hypothetical protein